MREYIFRGKTVTTDRWAYGHYAYADGFHVIYEEGTPYIVRRNTLGQYIGRKNNEGKMIFEGDIVEIFSLLRESFQKAGVINFLDSSFGINITNSLFNKDSFRLLSEIEKMRVIGNIHDNPELIGDSNNG